MSGSDNLDHLDFYSFFTKYSLMDEYGFSRGVFSRLVRKFLPLVPEEDTIEYLLLHSKQSPDEILNQLNFKNEVKHDIIDQLSLSIKALCTKVIAFGLDNNIKAKFDDIEQATLPFEILLKELSEIDQDRDDLVVKLIQAMDQVETLIIDLRKKRSKIGINFHVTVTTRRILEYLQRAKDLLDLKLNIKSEDRWKELFAKYIIYAKQRNSIKQYIDRHSDLVALEIVEHTSSKGEKYIAEGRDAYWSFFKKSLLGGGIISLFSFFKIYIGSQDLMQIQYAFYYSINYALCFVIVTQVGGIIATKQPAMTASTIAKYIDSNDDLHVDSIRSVILLIRNVFSSQFISIVGNFLMAISLAIVLILIFHLFKIDQLPEMIKSDYLVKTVLPQGQVFFFAALAGCFLAVAGLVSGYIDNKVVAAKISYRITHNKWLLRSQKLADFIEQRSGIIIGNISLGFFLGSAFLFSYVLPFDLDIRHIAFSSANVGYSIFGNYDLNTFFSAIIGVLLIGFTNFIVSFSITLYLALKSRNAHLSILPSLLYNLAKDFLLNPLHYFKVYDEKT